MTMAMLVVRLLLLSLDQYQQLHDDIESTSTSTSASVSEECMRLLKTQSQLVLTLQQQVTIISQHKHHSISDNMEEWTLPLIAVLSWHGNHPMQPQFTAAHHSARLKVLQSAATTLTILIPIMGPAFYNQQCIWINTIVACSMAFSLSSSFSNHQNPLERGIDCQIALFQLIRILFANPRQDDNPITIKLLKDNHIVATIVATCIDPITPDEHIKQRKKDTNRSIEALQTLDTLLDALPRQQQLWQQLFPGSFVGLCRHIMSHLKHNNSSSEAVSKAIQIMAKLCTITCQSNHSVKKESLHMINALQTHFHQDSLSNTHNDVCIDFQNVNEFSKEINSRLPLIFPPLFNALHSTTSPKVRLATTELCRTVLIHITHVLKGNTKAAMEHCALDSCMILTRDTDKNIIKAASDVINDYKDSMGDDLWKLYCNEIISGRILDLTVKASALAKSQRVSELRATLQLIAAYLACLGDLRRVPFGIEALTTFRRELCEIFDIDFDSSYLSTIVSSSEALERAIMVQNNDNHSVHFRFRYLGEATLPAAKGLIHAFTVALGQKNAHLFVDATFADLFESCSQRAQQSSSLLVTSSQVSWLHEWIGMVFLVNQCTITGSVREQRKARTRLESLAAAIIPILTTAPLWTLPTKLDSGISPNPFSSLFTATALKGNAVLVCLLVDTVGAILRNLGDKSRMFLSISLFPLIEKTSSSNHWLVKHEALRILNDIASALHISVTMLVEENFDYIFASVHSNLRPRGGSDNTVGTSRDFCDVSDLVMAILNILCNEQQDNSNINYHSQPFEVRPILRKTHVLRMIEVVRSLTARFDISSRMGLPTTDRDVMLLGLLGVYSASLRFIKSALGVEVSSESSTGDANLSISYLDQWLEILEPFRTKDTGITACPNGFHGINNPNRPESKQLPKRVDFYTEEVDILRLILARCGYSLSSPNLTIKVASVATQADAFGILGLVAMYYVDESEEDDTNQSPRTAVLRQIHESWPSVIAGLGTHKVFSASPSKALSANVFTEKTCDERALSSQYFFVALIFKLITSMCDASGDFIVGRLLDDVWPTIPKLINMFLRQSMSVSTSILSAEAPMGSSKGIDMTEKDKLLVAILHFLAQTFGQVSTGKRLAGNIDSTGTLIIPLLAFSDPIGSYAMDTLKAMIRIDSDALRRALYSTSGRNFPDCPFQRTSQALSVTLQIDAVSSGSALQDRASQLIDFAEGLPEQKLG